MGGSSSVPCPGQRASSLHSWRVQHPWMLQDRHGARYAPTVPYALQPCGLGCRSHAVLFQAEISFIIIIIVVVIYYLSYFLALPARVPAAGRMDPRLALSFQKSKVCKCKSHLSQRLAGQSRTLDFYLFCLYSASEKQSLRGAG